MSEPKKKPGVAFWTAVVVAPVLLYVLSFGPACWIISRTRIGESSLPAIYRPVTALMVIDGSPADVKRQLGVPSGSLPDGHVWKKTAMFFYPRGWVSKYASLGAAESWKWRFEVPIEYSPDAIARMEKGRWKWFRDGR